MTQERHVFEALQKAVTAAVAGTNSPPVKYLNRNFNPPSTGMWWEIIMIPNNIANEFWGSEETYRGILRLLLHSPQNDKGVYPLLDEVERVSQGFAKGSKFIDPASEVVVSVTDNPTIMGVYEEPPQIIAALTVRYSCFKP